jgi:hypothetical protein
MAVADIRSSDATSTNSSLRQRRAVAGESNTSWLQKRDPSLSDCVLLIGGTSLAHFRVRCAQAVMRRDLLPSFWSQVGILTTKHVLTVPVDTLSDVSRVPDANGLERTRVEAFDDRHMYPNLAVCRFTETMTHIIACAKEVSPRRPQLDVPRLMIQWLK